MMKISVFLIVISLLLVSCQADKETNRTFQGDWDVQWVTSPGLGEEPIPGMNYSMNGKMSFDSNGKMKIQAFGYNNCIFQRDTSENTLLWTINADTLFLRNEDDEYSGIPYVIKETGEDKIKLQLVEDIYLFLTK